MRKKQLGFSLLEVACIIVIMGLVGVAAVPSIHQVRKQETEQFARELCLDLTEYRTKTKMGGTDNEYVLELLLGSNGNYTGYTITKPGESNAETKRYGAKGFNMTMRGNKSGVTEAIEKMHFVNGTIQSDTGNEYQNVEIQIKNDNVKRKVMFYTETGYYKIKE